VGQGERAVTRGSYRLAGPPSWEDWYTQGGLRTEEEASGAAACLERSNRTHRGCTASALISMRFQVFGGVRWWKGIQRRRPPFFLLAEAAVPGARYVGSLHLGSGMRELVDGGEATPAAEVLPCRCSCCR